MDNPDDYEIVKVPGTGGSLTALPIIETLLGDVSAYIPTNVISITDGQIFLETDLFNQGQRPAINTGLSVSRVGSDAQRKAMKKVVGSLKADLAQYRELAAFAQFGSDLDRATQRQLDRGARLMEILKQPQYRPYSLAHEVMVIYASTRGFLDEVPVADVVRWKEEFLHYMDTARPEVGQAIATTYQFTEETETALREALQDFNASRSQAARRPGKRHGCERGLSKRIRSVITSLSDQRWQPFQLRRRVRRRNRSRLRDFMASLCHPS